MDDRVTDALFEKFCDLDQIDPFFYSSALLYVKALCRIRKDNDTADFLEKAATEIPPTRLNLWSLQTVYSSIMYGSSGLLNSKVKIDGIHFAAIHLGECLNNFYELLFEIFMSLYFEEPIDWGIADDYEERQSTVLKLATGVSAEPAKTS